MFWTEIWKNIRIFIWKFSFFLVVNFSIYLNRRVFVMLTTGIAINTVIIKPTRHPLFTFINYFIFDYRKRTKINHKMFKTKTILLFNGFLIFYPKKNIRLLWQIRFSTRTIVKLCPWPRDVKGLVLLILRRVPSGNNCMYVLLRL